MNHLNLTHFLLYYFHFKRGEFQTSKCSNWQPIYYYQSTITKEPRSNCAATQKLRNTGVECRMKLNKIKTSSKLSLALFVDLSAYQTVGNNVLLIFLQGGDATGQNLTQRIQVLISPTFLWAAFFVWKCIPQLLCALLYVCIFLLKGF